MLRALGRWVRDHAAWTATLVGLAALIAVVALVVWARAGHPAASGPAAPRAGTPFSGQFSDAAGSIRYLGYLPSGYRPGQALPLVVALHGCTETADQFRQLTGFDRLADQRRFIVLYPQQDPAASFARCWSWWNGADILRGIGEPALIAGLTTSVAQRYGADPRRIYAAGLSAGGAMSAVMGATYPDLYAAIGVGSGCEYAGWPCVGSSGLLDPTVAGQLAYLAMGARARPMPAVIFQGDADTTVPALNAEQLVRQWQLTADWADDGLPNGSVPATATAVVEGRAPGGRAYTVSTYQDGSGRELEQLWLVHGMGHAWSGGCACQADADPAGPSESEAMYDFFSRHPMASPVAPATVSLRQRW
jgi:poly(hydroxyalkanoate) depolymerase family esterase